MTTPLARIAYRVLFQQSPADIDFEEDMVPVERSEGEHEHHEGDMDHEEKSLELTDEERAEWIENFSYFIQFVFVFIAFGNVWRFGVEAFRYRDTKSYYENG